MTDDDVRRKRLARLGGAGGPPTPVSNAVTAPDAAVDTAGVGSSAGGTAASSSSLVAEAQRSAPPKPLKAAVAPKPAPAPSSLSSQPSTKMDIDKVPSGRKKKTRIEKADVARTCRKRHRKKSRLVSFDGKTTRCCASFRLRSMLTTRRAAPHCCRGWRATSET